MVTLYVVKRYRGLIYIALAGGLCATLPATSQTTESLPPTNLREEVRDLRRETSDIRNRIEILNHKLEALIDQLGVTIREPTVRRTDVIESSTPRVASTRPAADEEHLPSPSRQLTQGTSTPQEVMVRPVNPFPQVPGASSVQEQFAWANRSPAASKKERQAYLDALAYLEQGASDGDYRRLRRALRGFVKTYPGGIHEPKARYLIAESWYTDKRYRQATQGFLHYIHSFPEGEHVDDAWLKLADVYYAQDQAAKATRLLERLSNSDNERVRELARRKLQSISEPADR